MAADLRQVTECAKRLRNHDPKIYEQFIRLLDQWVYDVTVAVTEAPADHILVAQGRAQQMRKVYQILTEITDTP